MDCMSYFFHPSTIYDAHTSVKLQAVEKWLVTQTISDITALLEQNEV